MRVAAAAPSKVSMQVERKMGIHFRFLVAMFASCVGVDAPLVGPDSHQPTVVAAVGYNQNEPTELHHHILSSL